MPYRIDDFNGCINQSFNLELSDSSPYPLELISVDRHPGSATVGDYEVFSVVFRANDDAVLEQQIYRINHETLGDLDLFIVPIGADEKGMRYEAVFS